MTFNINRQLFKGYVLIVDGDEFGTYSNYNDACHDLTALARRI